MKEKLIKYRRYIIFIIVISSGFLGEVLSKFENDYKKVMIYLSFALLVYFLLVFTDKENK